MTLGNFHYLTGKYIDQVNQSLGLRRSRIRYNGKPITPNPILSDRGIQSQSDGTEFQLEQAEQVQTYFASIAEDVLSDSLGVDRDAAIVPDAIWEIQVNSESDWVAVRLLKTPAYNPVGRRYGFEFAEAGVGEVYVP